MMFGPADHLFHSADAIRARRAIEEESSDWGEVIIRTGQDESGLFLEIEDTGIGMSPKVLTGPFLDFGQSFWGSPLMHEELPGLESKNFSSTGKYCFGRTPLQTFEETLSLAKEKQLDDLPPAA